MRRACILFGLSLVLACGPHDPPTAVGREAGQRIISLSPAITRVLLALEVGSELVAVDRFSRELPAVHALPSLGGVFSPDLERAVELRPTIVLAVRSIQQLSFFAQLRSRGVRVEEIEPYTLEEVFESFILIGRHVGRQAEGEALVRRVRAELEEVAASVRDLPRVSVALVLERDPLFVAGGGGFIHSLIEIAGGRNAFGDLEAAYPRVSLESLAARRPELILDAFFDPEREESSRAESRAYWLRFAWVRRLEPFPPSTAILPSPELADGARLMRVRIHPESARP